MNENKINRHRFRWILGSLIVNLISVSSHFLFAETGARFLKLGLGARELAMGGSGNSITHDVNAIYWNPAGLNTLTGSQLGLTHSEWLMDTRYDAAVFAHHTKPGTIAVSGIFLNEGTQEGRGENRERTGGFSSSDFAATVAYAPHKMGLVQTGMAVKFLQSRIGTDQAQGLAFDLGSQVQLDHQGSSTLGISARNIGPALKFIHQSDPLPLMLAVGMGKTFFHGLVVSAEYQSEPHDHVQRFVMGTELQLISTLSLRGGYGALLNSTQPQINNGGKFSGFVGGVGLNWKAFTLDFAFSPFGELGDTQRFSLISKF